MNAEENVNTEVTEAASDGDLAMLDTAAGAEEGAVMEVRNPGTGEVVRFRDGRPFTIKFRGKDSKAVQDLARNQQDRRIQTNMRTRQPVLAGSIDKDNIELLVAATISVDMLLDGKPVENKATEYRKLYTRFRWLFEQGDEFTGARINFPLKSA